jgi:transposase, IS30 family
MSYSHLSIIERGQLETLMKMGISQRAIARHLKRNPSTISREIKRGVKSEKGYQALASQKGYHERRESSKPIGKFTPELKAELESKLEQTWSPEQIAGKYRTEGLPLVCFKTIYRWVYEGRLQVGVNVLRQKGKRQKPAETRGRFCAGTSISQRPCEIRKRDTFGHWELDTVVSSRGKSKACVATFIERKTRMYLALKMPDRTAHSMEVACGVIASQFPQAVMQSATVDRGKEFACYASLERHLSLAVYFADPYSSWQRGSNENGNGLLREFFPKGHDFATVTDEQLAYSIKLINDRPRKCLGWRSAHDVFTDEVLHLA